MRRSLDRVRARIKLNRPWLRITWREQRWSNLQVTFWFAHRRNVGTFENPRWED